MDQRKALDGQAMGLMVVLCLIWGLQQVVLKMAASDVPPLFMIALRSGIAAVLVGLLMLRQGVRIRWGDGTMGPGLVVGALFGLEFWLVGEGLRYTSASHMVVFLYTAPIFVAFALHWKLPAERLSPLQWLGVALAFAGIVITFVGRGQGGDKLLTDMLWGDLLALLAGVAWAATTVGVRLTALSREAATKTLFYQLVVGFLLLMLAASLSGQAVFRPTPVAWGALFFQGVIVSFASYLSWFWLLRHYLASRLGVFSFLAPLFGVAFGVGLLGEPLEASFLAGAVLVCSGILLVSGFRTVSKARG